MQNTRIYIKYRLRTWKMTNALY